MRVTCSSKAFFEVVDFVIEGLSLGVSFEKSKGFALYETFSDPVRVVGREMRIFKSLCRFKMCADVEDSLVVKSLAFVNRKRENCLKYWKKRTTILEFLILQGNSQNRNMVYYRMKCSLPSCLTLAINHTTNSIASRIFRVIYIYIYRIFFFLLYPPRIAFADCGHMLCKLYLI